MTQTVSIVFSKTMKRKQMKQHTQCLFISFIYSFFVFYKFLSLPQYIFNTQYYKTHKSHTPMV